MRVICKNNKNKPNKIPLSQWLVEDQFYTVVRVMNMGIQANTYGYELEEINLDGCFPYEYYNANRFAVVSTSKTEKAEEIFEEDFALV
jgi:hypothetical protein